MSELSDILKNDGFYFYSAWTGSGKTEEVINLVVEILLGRSDETLVYACFRRIEILEFLIRLKRKIKLIDPTNTTYYMKKLFIKMGKDVTSEDLQEIENSYYSIQDKVWINRILEKENDFISETLNYKESSKAKALIANEKFKKSKVKIITSESIYNLSWNLKNTKIIFDEIPYSFLRYLYPYNKEGFEGCNHNFKLARKFKKSDDEAHNHVKKEALKFKWLYSIVNDDKNTFEKLNHCFKTQVVMSASIFHFNKYNQMFGGANIVFGEKNIDLLKKALKNITYVDVPFKDGNDVLTILTKKQKGKNSCKNSIHLNKTGSNVYRNLNKINVFAGSKFNNIDDVFGDDADGIMFDKVQQSIWRSALRDGKRVKIFFEDKNLQKLFQEKLEELLKFFK